MHEQLDARGRSDGGLDDERRASSAVLGLDSTADLAAETHGDVVGCDDLFASGLRMVGSWTAAAGVT